MKKFIISALMFIGFVPASYAEQAYIMYAHATGQFSIEFMPGNCGGNFDINNNLILTIDKIKQKYCTDSICPVTIYDGTNCNKTNKVVASGTTNLVSGESKLTNFMPNNYFITGTNYYIGLDAR